MVPDLIWARYKDIINQFHADAFQDNIIWKKSKGGLDRYGEDKLNERFEDITIQGLFQFNNFRTWPLTMFENVGSYDQQSQALFLNIKYLKDNNWVDSSNKFIYNASADRFIFRGVTYIAAGDTFVSQAKDEPLLFMLILKVEQYGIK